MFVDVENIVLWAEVATFTVAICLLWLSCWRAPRSLASSVLLMALLLEVGLTLWPFGVVVVVVNCSAAYSAIWFMLPDKWGNVKRRDSQPDGSQCNRRA